MEWVHCHIARQPVPPAERAIDVPPAVAGIIMRLLAKTAEQRYQTAAGVERDLRRCLTQWEAEHRIDEFRLGEHETPDRLLIPETLYGREREIATLFAAFDRVAETGTPELVLVSGYSGIGKSSVVNELHKALLPPRGLFASGKFDQGKRGIPYASIAQAFQSLVRRLLATSDAELAVWRAALEDALGPNGQLMIDLVPELKLIIGEQPPVPELPPLEAQRRFSSWSCSGSCGCSRGRSIRSRFSSTTCSGSTRPRSISSRTCWRGPTSGTCWSSAPFGITKWVPTIPSHGKLAGDSRRGGGRARDRACAPRPTRTWRN